MLPAVSHDSGTQASDKRKMSLQHLPEEVLLQILLQVDSETLLNIVPLVNYTLHRLSRSHCLYEHYSENQSQVALKVELRSDLYRDNLKRLTLRRLSDLEILREIGNIYPNLHFVKIASRFSCTLNERKFVKITKALSKVAPSLKCLDFPDDWYWEPNMDPTFRTKPVTRTYPFKVQGIAVIINSQAQLDDIAVARIDTLSQLRVRVQVPVNDPMRLQRIDLGTVHTLEVRIDPSLTCMYRVMPTHLYYSLTRLEFSVEDTNFIVVIVEQCHQLSHLSLILGKPSSLVGTFPSPDNICISHMSTLSVSATLAACYDEDVSRFLSGLYLFLASVSIDRATLLSMHVKDLNLSSLSARSVCFEDCTITASTMLSLPSSVTVAVKRTRVIEWSEEVRSELRSLSRAYQDTSHASSLPLRPCDSDSPLRMCELIELEVSEVDSAQVTVLLLTTNNIYRADITVPLYVDRNELSVWNQVVSRLTPVKILTLRLQKKLSMRNASHEFLTFFLEHCIMAGDQCKICSFTIVQEEQDIGIADVFDMLKQLPYLKFLQIQSINSTMRTEITKLALQEWKKQCLPYEANRRKNKLRLFNRSKPVVLEQRQRDARSQEAETRSKWRKWLSVTFILATFLGYRFLLEHKIPPGQSRMI